MAKRVCNQPGCPVLVESGGKCTQHRRQADQARGTRQQRGYDKTHDRLRAAWQRRLDAGERVQCWRPDCTTVIDPGDWHLGHDANRVHRGPECPPCNLHHAGVASHQ